tara:strand:+ start:224 stop:727 length:504 start_codon:yes stop_codon:yes gene_type:complete
MDNQWIKKDIPIEPNPGVTVTFTYDQPYKDKFGNQKWLCVDGQYVQCSPTLLKMLESQGIKANMPVTIGKRQIDGKSHFTVNGQTATELLQGGGAPQGGFAPNPNIAPQPTPVQTNAPVNVGTPQQPQHSGFAELKVHLESALKLVNSLNVNVNEPIITPGNDELPF